LDDDTPGQLGLSGVDMLLLVFALQEGRRAHRQRYIWDRRRRRVYAAVRLVAGAQYRRSR